MRDLQVNTARGVFELWSTSDKIINDLSPLRCEIVATGSIRKVNQLPEANWLIERELFPHRSSFILYLHLDPWVYFITF